MNVYWFFLPGFSICWMCWKGLGLFVFLFLFKLEQIEKLGLGERDVEYESFQTVDTTSIISFVYIEVHWTLDPVAVGMIFLQYVATALLTEWIYFLAGETNQ